MSDKTTLANKQRKFYRRSLFTLVISASVLLAILYKYEYTPAVQNYKRNIQIRQAEELYLLQKSKSKQKLEIEES